MTYKTERDLQFDIVNFDFNFDDSHKISFVRREVPVGECIPDLICVHFIELPNPKVWPLRWSSKHSFIIWLLRKWNKLQPDIIAHLSFEAPDRIEPILTDLMRSGTINQIGSGELMLSEDVASVEAEVVAIEAKLRRWREALTQAERYKQFADRVVVAMDASNAPRQIEILKQFEDHGVGLCAVSSDSIQWLVYPAISKQASSHEREYLVTSAIVPSRQMRWSRRNALTASNQA